MDLKRLVWTDRETESLIDNVRIYKDIVFGPYSSTVSQAKKRETWEQIKNNVHAQNPNSPVRAAAAVRKKWENLIGLARKDIEAHKRTLANGGSPFYLKPMYRKIWTEIYSVDHLSLSGDVFNVSLPTYCDPMNSTVSCDYSSSHATEESEHKEAHFLSEGRQDSSPILEGPSASIPSWMDTRQRKRKTTFVLIEEQEKRERLKTEEQQLKTEAQRLRNEGQQIKIDFLQLELSVKRLELVQKLCWSSSSK